MTAIAPHLRLVTGERGELELNTALVRRFLGIADAEAIELTAFISGRIQVAHATTPDDHVRLLAEIQNARDFAGAYQLANGPINPELTYRYEPNKWHRASNGRATDRDIQALRNIFIDCDVIRPKGISSTDEEQRAAWEVAAALEEWLAETLGGCEPIGHGCSGNGYFALVALEPVAPSPETTRRISELLALLHKKFGTDRVKIDASVANPARLMPCPGTWKRKGRNTPERPHRLTSFICRGNVERVPLEALC